MSGVPGGDWNLGLGYARRTGHLQFQTVKDGQAMSPRFGVSLPDFMAQTGLTEWDLRDVLADKPAAPAPPEEDTDFGRMRLAAIPADLTGKTVLDVGGYDGFYARLCLERGASEVVLIDNGEWANYGWVAPPKVAGVRRIGCDLLEWEEPADVTMCFNVIYHVRDPWRALRRLRWLTREQLLLCTSFVEGDRPVWEVVDPDGPDQHTFDGYLTVFWRPSIPGLLLLLKRTGWGRVEEVGRAGDHVTVRCLP